MWRKPDRYKAVITNFKSGKLVDLAFESLNKNEVRVQIHAAPINPSDKNMVQGIYGEQGEGVGFEGSGKVVEVGEGVDKALIGKKVGIMGMLGMPGYTGTWREYCTTGIDNLMVFPDSAVYEQIAS